ncbi:MAG TPA: hypothetical protein VFI61_01100 [Patescibacteria group bacterium]|nr:hypothetical protein [Patescibacteria group bacterium]
MKYLKKMKPGNQVKGMTLIELIIVVTIIIVLALIIIAYFRNQLFKGNDARRKGDINRIKIAIEEYEKDHDCYPPPQLLTCDPGNGLTPYISKVPCDPKTRASYYYDYENSACPSWFRVYADLEATADTSQASCGPNSAFNFYVSSANAPACNLADSSFYGCRNNICVPILWDTTRNGPECDPSYQSSSCYGQCGTPVTECKDWH